MRMKRALLVLAPLVLILQAGSSWAQGGTGSFNVTINWMDSPDLYYNVNGGPPNTCGDLYANRNGAGYTVTYGWVCTDGSGNAVKGPWTWANQSGDEDAYVYIAWPSSSTNTAHHIWDKTAPSITIDSFASTPPTSFSGTGDDGSYGSGFSANFGSDAGVGFATASECRVKFQDTTTGLYWCPGFSTSYDTSVACTGSCTISGMPSRSVTWSADQVPPTTIYNSMHSYQWSVILKDNANLGQRSELGATF